MQQQNNIFMKSILKFFRINNRWAILGILILLFIGIVLWNVQKNRINELKIEKRDEIKLRNALVDSLNTYKNKEDDWVYEKLSLQVSIKRLEDINGNLNTNQQKLLKRINEVEKDNMVISAALINAEFIIDSLMLGGVVIDSTNKTIEFSDTLNPNLRYSFKIFNVVPFSLDTEPEFLIKKLSLPNDQFIDFKWEDNKKEGYPVSFSVTNSNEYYKVYDINSYIIPSIRKDDIDPTTWQKITQWFETKGKIVGYVAGGVIIGSGGMYILMQ